MNILVIEDDKKILKFIKRGFEEHGFSVDTSTNGNEGLYKLQNENYDVAVIDIMLPGLDGISMLKELRKNGISTPALILSAKQTVDDRVDGLRAGGDDYLIKPFAFAELLERIRALLRRNNGYSDISKLQSGEISIDVLKREVKRNSTLIDLKPKEYSLLVYMIENRDVVLSKTLIMEKIWDINFDPQTNVVDVLVCRLRDKIDKPFDKKYIHTIRGIGYVFKES
jgi:DNA-binding response OmpR family regulator